MEEVRNSWNPAMDEEEEEEVEEEYEGPTFPLTSDLLASQEPIVESKEIKFQQAKSKDKSCPEFHPTYDPRQLVEISLHLDVLMNFALADPPTPGQFIIRVCLHDDVIYHSLSHSTLGPAVPFDFTESPPDIIVDDEIRLKYRFKDIIDTPIFLRLIDIKGCELTSETDLSQFSPIGYICLDVASLLKYQNGYIEQHIEPWIISDPEVDKTFLNGRPLLQVNIECKEGMPTKAQLRQGNLITFFVGSMYHVPDDLFPFAAHPECDPKLDVILTFPHSGKHPFLHFKEGQYNDTIYREPPATSLDELDAATQTKDPDDVFQRNASEGMNRFAPTRHWASIIEHHEGIPFVASAVSHISVPPREDPNEEVYGDAAELYKTSMDQRKYCEEPIVEWNSQHIRYIPVESYQKMLSRLSHEVVWPLEIVMTVKKPEGQEGDENAFQVKKKSKEYNRKSSSKGTKKSKKMEQSQVPDGLGDGDSADVDFQFLNALGETREPDRLIAYHGIAFVNLSQLVHPGKRKVRFACRVYPYSKQLMGKFTCLSKSAVESVLPYAHEAPEIFGETTKRRMSREEEKCHPFIVLEVQMKRSIVPLFKVLKDMPELVQDYIVQREIPRRRLVSADTAKKRFKQSVVNSAAEIANEFSNHFWKDVVLQGNKTKDGSKTPFPSSVNLQALKKAFVFYLNASGRYLVLREHLREAVTQFTQQRCLDLKRDSPEFKTHRDFHSFLSDMYVHLCDEVHETLSETALQEPDPLDPIPNIPSPFCPDGDSPDAPLPFKEYEKKSLLRNLLFYSEESLAQGDYENAQRLHLQRICISKEDSSCWTDYGISWLSRGDHRMAEIALKEAIRQNPNNTYVLLLGGLMSVLYNDERGVDCLTVALGLRPSCPEIMVILALAYAQLGNEIASDYFFRRAAHFHRVLTGRSTSEVDDKIDELSKFVGIKQSLQNLGKVEESMFPSGGGGGEEANLQAAPSTKLKTAGGKGKKKDGGKAAEGSSEKEGTKSKGKSPGKGSGGSKGGSSKGGSSKGGSSDGKSESSPAEEKEEGASSSPPGTEDKKMGGEPRRFDFTKETEAICLSEVYLPPFSPSIRIPWNVTEFESKLKGHLDALEGKSGTGESGIPNDDSIKDEYDKLLELERNETGTSASSSDPQAIDKALNQIRMSAKKVSGGKKGGKSKPNSGPASVVSATDRLSTSSGKQQKRRSGQQDEEEQQQEEEGGRVGGFPLTRSQEGVQRRLLEKKVVEKPPEVFDDRLGSELIWTAQLLLQLRMFDLLDGVLARELLIVGKRSLQFLYLRGMSFYMRQSQRIAVVYFDEGLKVDPENAILWILKGHCYYETGQNVEAAEAYEKALHLPVGKENRHLMYLRYGTLSLDAGNWEIAKKVFLHGVQKYPTPYMWLAIGNTCYALKEYDQAEAAFAEANRLDNTDPITWAHLSLVNLAQNQRVLAEQSYKWALRFGLKKGKVLDEIRRLQEEKGFGDPSFPRVPNCIPHDYFVRRLGRQKPFDMYRDALMNEQPSLGRPRFDDSEREKELKAGILKIAGLQGNLPPPLPEEINDEEMLDGEEEEEEEEEMVDEAYLSGLQNPNDSIFLIKRSLDPKNRRKSGQSVVGKRKSKTGGGKKQGKNKDNSSKARNSLKKSKDSKRNSGRTKSLLGDSLGGHGGHFKRNNSKTFRKPNSLA